MANYRMVCYCRLCKGRYILEKGDPKTAYCEKCQERLRNQPKEDEE